MDRKPPGVLYLLPLPIAEGEPAWTIPAMVLNQISEIQCFIVENAKTARQYIKRVHPSVQWDQTEIFELDKHRLAEQDREILALLKTRPVIGLMSEAGLPCIADPGNRVVRLAHDQGWKIKPMSGPSSIILALIASGLNGQQFTFNGYLPVKTEERKKAIQQLEKASRGTTQLFIEAPYRNAAMKADLLRTLQPSTRLLIASNICGENESIVCRPVQWWRENPVEIEKIPCLFAIGS